MIVFSLFQKDVFFFFARTCLKRKSEKTKIARPKINKQKCPPCGRTSNYRKSWAPRPQQLETPRLQKNSFSFLFFSCDGLEGKLRKDQTSSQCLAVKRMLSLSTLKHSPGKSKRENRENNEHLEPITVTPNKQMLKLTR